MITIKQLSDVRFDALVTTVNESYKDYPQPILFTEDTLKAKLESLNTNLDYSFGVYDDDNLVGFVIHALNGAVAYHVMSGIIPTYRKQGLYTRMFEAALSYFNMFGIDTYQLEVSKDTQDVVQMHKKNGFEITTTYNCYRGAVTNKPESAHDINLEFDSDISRLRHLEKHHPSFAHYNGTPYDQNIYTIKEAEDVVAFLALLNDGTVRHFGYTKPEHLHALLFNVSRNDDVLIIDNIDSYAKDVTTLLESLGFVLYAQQYQMELTI